MQIEVNESVAIDFACSLDLKRKYRSWPRKMSWRGKVYEFNNVAYYHKSRVGRVIYHVFHVSDGSNDFKLIFDPEVLSWRLVEVTDGNTN